MNNAWLMLLKGVFGMIVLSWLGRTVPALGFIVFGIGAIAFFVDIKRNWQVTRGELLAEQFCLRFVIFMLYLAWPTVPILLAFNNLNKVKGVSR